MMNTYNNIDNKRRRGLTLVEAALVMGIMGISFAGLSTMLAENSRSARVKASSERLIDITGASQAYIAANRQDLLSMATSGAPLVIPIARTCAACPTPTGPGSLPSLQEGGFISSAFIDGNSNGHNHVLLVRQPESGVLEAMVTAYGGTPFSDRDLGQISINVGAGGGGVYENSPNAPSSQVVGTHGGWQEARTQWSGTFGGNNVTPNVGRPAVTMAFTDIAASVDVDQFLHRSDTGNPEHNRMNVSIDMNGNDINEVNQVLADRINARRAAFAENVTVGGSMTAGSVLSDNNVVAGVDVIAGRDLSSTRDIASGRHITANSSITAGNNITAGNDLRAGQDVAAGRFVTADVNITAGNNVRASNDLIANNDIRADNDIRAGQDVAAGRFVTADVNITAGNNVRAANDLIANNDIRADRNLRVSGGAEIEGNTNLRGNVSNHGVVNNHGTVNNNDRVINYGRVVNHDIVDFNQQTNFYTAPLIRHDPSTPANGAVLRARNANGDKTLIGLYNSRNNRALHVAPNAHSGNELDEVIFGTRGNANSIRMDLTTGSIYANNLPDLHVSSDGRIIVKEICAVGLGGDITNPWNSQYCLGPINP